MDFSKSKYSEEIVKQSIIDVMKSMNINHMPSRSEMHIATQNDCLINIVMRTGGFYGWANKLGIPCKKSDTLTGIKYEQKCCDFLNAMGLESELTPVKFPYDVLVHKFTKIDVKISNGYDGTCFFFAFNLESKIPKSDFYVLYCVNKRQTKTLIIPSHVFYGIGQVSIGLSSMYDSYIDRWDLIEKHIQAMKKVGLGDEYYCQKPRTIS